MAKNARAEADPPPTMIIPKDTEIHVDTHGQLSIRAPGNLVIQNSGHYGNLESVNGSIRIEPDVEVEAVSVRCPETCYVQGSLTAWKVSAYSLQLEDTAKAHVVLQDTQRLEIGKGARLVGNFNSEKELFFLFSRFSSQVRSLPIYQQSTGEEAEEAPRANGRSEASRSLPSGPGEEVQGAGVPDSMTLLTEAPAEAAADLPEPLFFALMLLERGKQREETAPEDGRILKEVVKLLAEGELETLRHTHRTLFGRIRGAGDEIQRARELVADYFAKEKNG
ncbi:MAG: hypothetical protein KDD47_12120 [Acidobacteria bacterium]|nr:hypothetical protein [Acidobacteriota bacterium]